MKHIMLDLETLATDSHATVVSIGAFAFKIDYASVSAADSDDPERWKEIGTSFYVDLNLDEQVELKRNINVGTVQWWMQQSAEAQRAVLTKERVPVKDALRHFGQFVRDQGTACMWGNGSDFDCIILGNLIEAAGFEKPWSYGKNRCFRTMKAVFPLPKPERFGTHHHALDDAVTQSVWLLRMVNKYPGILGYANDGVVQA